jgi:regulatory protein
MLGRPSRLPEIEPPDGGVISRIAPQVNDPDRCSLYLDGEFALGLHASVVAEAGLHSGMELDRSDCEKLISKDLYHRAWGRSLDYLSHKSRTSVEVMRRLSDIGAPDDISRRIVDRLTELGYLDDEDYARRYVTSRFRSRGYGPHRLRRELRRKGIPRALAEQAVSGLDDAETYRRLEELARKALHRYRDESSSRDRRRKASAWLARRGYAFDRIRTVLDRLAPDD